MRYRAVSHEGTLDLIQRIIRAFSAEECYALVYIF